jgi:hypothetical protein
MHVTIPNICALLFVGFFMVVWVVILAHANKKQ